jgi:hypothetical protein
LAIARWNPDSRAGAIAVRPRGAHDVKCVERISNVVQDWASYQNLSGETDSAETVTVSGPYDWRADLHEAAEQARRDVGQKPAKKTERAAPAAPSVFYA